MSFCDTLLYMENVEVCVGPSGSWASKDDDDDMEGIEKPGLWSSWSLRESFWLESTHTNTHIWSLHFLDCICYHHDIPPSFCWRCLPRPWSSFSCSCRKCQSQKGCMSGKHPRYPGGGIPRVFQPWPCLTVKPFSQQVIAYRVCVN